MLNERKNKQNEDIEKVFNMFNSRHSVNIQFDFKGGDGNNQQWQI